MSLNESNAAAELERLIEPDTLNSTLLCSAPASSQQLEQIGLPEERHDKFIALARTLISEGVTRPEMLAEFLDEVRPDRSLRKYSEALWDMLGVADKSLRGTHDWQAIYAKLDKPKKSMADKKPGQQRRPTAKKKATEEALASMPPIWRDVLQDQWSGKTIEDIAAARHISIVAVGNILRQAGGRFRILMDRAATKPTVRVEEPKQESKPPAKPRSWLSRLFGRRTPEAPTKTWRKAWQAWCLNSFPSQLLLDDPKLNHRVISEIRYEVISARGKRAILLGTAWHERSMAVHEFKADGTASRGPYFVKSANWRFSGKRHIATMAKAKDDYSFESTHPTQHGGGIPSRLIKITEFNTTKSEPYSYETFASLAESNPSEVDNPQPDP